MKSTKIGFKMLIAGCALVSVVTLNSCNKTQDAQSSVQANSADDAVAATPVALWGFDSTWKEAKQNLAGKPHKDATFTGTGQAKSGKAAFISTIAGFVTYANAGTAVPNLTSGFTVDFWVYPSKASSGAHCIWCLPQTGAFWPDHHVLIDGWNSAKVDTGLIKIMFKANRGVPYDEEWTEIGNIPNFYKHWNHIQYAYDGATSKFTVKINGTIYVDHQTKYDSDPTTGGQPLGNINANPGTHGIVFGAVQNQWRPTLFGAPESWMGTFKGRIDAFRVYDSALF